MTKKHIEILYKRSRFMLNGLQMALRDAHKSIDRPQVNFLEPGALLPHTHPDKVDPSSIFEASSRHMFPKDKCLNNSQFIIPKGTFGVLLLSMANDEIELSQITQRDIDSIYRGMDNSFNLGNLNDPANKNTFIKAVKRLAKKIPGDDFSPAEALIKILSRPDVHTLSDAVTDSEYSELMKIMRDPAQQKKYLRKKSQATNFEIAHLAFDNRTINLAVNYGKLNSKIFPCYVGAMYKQIKEPEWIEMRRTCLPYAIRSYATTAAGEDMKDMIDFIKHQEQQFAFVSQKILQFDNVREIPRYLLEEISTSSKYIDTLMGLDRRTTEAEVEKFIQDNLQGTTAAQFKAKVDDARARLWTEIRKIVDTTNIEYDEEFLDDTNLRDDPDFINFLDKL